jgi:DNA-directed RNA polymerase specialized sigma24 family protein
MREHAKDNIIEHICVLFSWIDQDDIRQEASVICLETPAISERELQSRLIEVLRSKKYRDSYAGKIPHYYYGVYLDLDDILHDGLGGEYMDELISNATCDENTEKRYVDNIMVSVVDKLPSQARRVIALLYFYGYTTQEASKLTQKRGRKLTASAIRKRHAKALEMLREMVMQDTQAVTIKQYGKQGK